jgi:hypothetical protein
MSVFDLHEEFGFPITQIDRESRIKLAATLLGRLMDHNPTLSVDETLQTVNDCITHFEVVSSAVESGFIKSYDDTAYFNGYPLRIYVPELEPEN